MVQLSTADSHRLDGLRAWAGRFHATRPVAIVTSGYAVCIHSSLVLAAVASSKVFVAALLLSVPADLAAVVAFLVTFAVYNHDKLTDLEEDSVNVPDRVAFFDSWATLFVVLSAAAYVVALGLSALGGPMALALTLFPGVVGILYSTTWLPVTEADRLKDVLVVSTAAVGVAWAVPLALLPLAFENAAYGSAAFVVVAFFFLRTCIGVEVFNVRDVEGDRREGVRTLPVVLGVRWTQYVLGTLNVCSLALLVGAVLVGVLAPVVIVLTPAIAYSLGITALLGNSGAVDRLCTASYIEYPLMAALLAVAIALG